MREIPHILEEQFLTFQERLAQVCVSLLGFIFLKALNSLKFSYSLLVVCLHHYEKASFRKAEQPDTQWTPHMF